ncbi:hypothetical protein MTBLM1_90019 [Rhodospirillaceae bacterium LM-1]|nr:hypothetical protein MTBLM1_90019 [Rhodospirillaceae bacterium LM-1]
MDLFNSVCEATKEAIEELEKISGGDWPSSYGMAEYALSVPIAQKLYKKMQEKISISFDELYSRIWNWEFHRNDQHGSEENPFHKSRARADIALWSDRDKRLGCVEIKRKFEAASARKDLDRLCSASKHFGPDFQAFFVVFSSGNTSSDAQTDQIYMLKEGRDGYAIKSRRVDVPSRSSPPRLANGITSPDENAVAVVFQIKKA